MWILNRILNSLIKFKAPWEGDYVKGFLYRPLIKNGAMVVYCHGGFGGLGEPLDYPEVFMFLRHGYTVLCLDYGQGFPKHGLAGDVVRVKRAVSYSRANGFRKVFLAGVSRGGFVAAWGIIDLWSKEGGERVDGGVVVAAPVHLASFKNETTIPKGNLDRIMIYFDFNENEEESSPINYSRKLSDTLFIYGTEDVVVRLSQGKKCKEKSLNVLFFGEGHNLFRSKGPQKMAVRWLERLMEIQRKGGERE